MALFHFHIKPISRKTHKSAVAAAAYRAGQMLKSDDGQIFDFRKRKNVIFSEIFVPDGEKKINRENLWNLAEKSERRKDSRTAREYEAAIPRELLPGYAVELAKKFTKEIVKRFHVAADLAIHKQGNGSNENIHFHLLTTTRAYENGILTNKTDIEKEEKTLRKEGKKRTREMIEELRIIWAEMANSALAERGINAHIDNRSLAARGIDRPAQLHMGPKVTALLQRGEFTFISAYNMAIKKLFEEKKKNKILFQDIENEIKFNFEAIKLDYDKTLQSKLKKNEEFKILRKIEKIFKQKEKHKTTDHNQNDDLSNI